MQLYIIVWGTIHRDKSYVVVRFHRCLFDMKLEVALDMKAAKIWKAISMHFFSGYVVSDWLYFTRKNKANAFLQISFAQLNSSYTYNKKL